jgi:hypothetical protein
MKGHLAGLLRGVLLGRLRKRRCQADLADWASKVTFFERFGSGCTQLQAGV